MIIAIFCASLAVLVSIGIYLLSSGKVDKTNQVLTDLGLSHGLASPLKSPFYKWGWRKTTDDRVWGERIVREAFEKHNIGLSQQDLDFFSQVCSRYANGDSIDKASIVSHVEKILARSSSISNFASGFIVPILERSLRASPAQAQKLLEREKVQSSPANAPDRLAVRQITKMLKSHGLRILSTQSMGLEVKSESGDFLMSLAGFDSWEFWLKSCRDSLEQCLSNRSLIKSNSQAKFLRSQISNGIIQNYINQLKKTRHFIKTIEKLLTQESIPRSRSDIENLERIFYTWHFSEGIRFSLQDHASLQDLIALPELPSRFRQALFDYINSSFESLHALLLHFPRHVIFMGSNPETRSYAAQQYLVHLSKLSKTISDVIGRKLRIPLFLRILETDVQKARNPDPLEYKASLLPPKEESHNNEEEISGNTGHMPLLLDSQKRMIIFERNMDPSSAEKMGWIIELPIEDLTPKEYAQLDLGDYLRYKRINCSQFDGFEQNDEGKSGQFKREKFLNQIFDKLLEESIIPNFLDDSE